MTNTRSHFIELQEQILKEEKAFYEHSVQEFQRQNDADLKNAPYIQQEYIKKIYPPTYGFSDLKEYIKEVEKELRNVEQDPLYIKVRIEKEMNYIETVGDADVSVFDGYWIIGYKLLPEKEIRSKAKNSFIKAITQKVYDRYIELSPLNPKNQRVSTPSCFLIESYLNGEIEFDFLVKATYKGCDI